MRPGGWPTGWGEVRCVWEGSFLAQLGEAETCSERSFLKSFSPHTFPQETCAERSISERFSPHMLRPGAPVCARLQSKPARNGHVCGHYGQNLREMANLADIARREAFEKLLSAHVSLQNMRGEKLFRKLLSAHVSASPAQHVNMEACASSCRTPHHAPRATHHTHRDHRHR